MADIQAARRRTDDGSETSMSELFGEAVDNFYESTDMKSGYPKRQCLTAPAPPHLTIFLPSNLTLFHNTVDCRRNDEWLRRAMDETWLMVRLADAEDRCLHVSQALLRYTGLEPDRFLNSSWIELIHPDHRAIMMEKLSVSFQSRQPFRYFYRLRHRDDWGWVLDEAWPRHRPDGNFTGYVNTIHEIGGPGAPVEMLICDGGSWKSPLKTTS